MISAAASSRDGSITMRKGRLIEKVKGKGEIMKVGNNTYWAFKNNEAGKQFATLESARRHIGHNPTPKKKVGIK